MDGNTFWSKSSFCLDIYKGSMNKIAIYMRIRIIKMWRIFKLSANIDWELVIFENKILFEISLLTTAANYCLQHIELAQPNFVQSVQLIKVEIKMSTAIVSSNLKQTASNNQFCSTKCVWISVKIEDWNQRF